MTLDELIEAARRDRLDDAVEPYLTSDAQMKRHFNDAVKQACIRTRSIIDSSTASVASIALVADQREYSLHQKVLAIRHAYHAGLERQLTPITMRQLDRIDPRWRSAESGNPEYVIVDANPGKVWIYPTPADAGTLELTVWRSPLESEELDVGEDEPIIDALYHLDLLDWVEYRVYSGTDAETRDPEKANAAAAAFTARFGAMPSMHSIRLWGISPRRGGAAHFM